MQVVCLFLQHAHPAVTPNKNVHGTKEVHTFRFQDCKCRLDRVSRRSGTPQSVETPQRALQNDNGPTQTWTNKVLQRLLLNRRSKQIQPKTDQKVERQDAVVFRRTWEQHMPGDAELATLGATREGLPRPPHVHPPSGARTAACTGSCRYTLSEPVKVSQRRQKFGADWLKFYSR